MTHAAAICFASMPKRDPDLVIASAAIAPILHKIAGVMLGLGMSKRELKEYVLSDGECFAVFIDYVFDRFVPEFALEDAGGIYRLIYDPTVAR